MKTPIFLTGLSLLFWGWQTGLIWVAIILIPIVEGARFNNSKWDFSVSDFNKVTDLCTLLLAATIVTALILKPEKAIILTIKWLPVILFPLIAVQEYSLKGKIDIKALFIVARRRKAISNWPLTQELKKIDISYIYAGFCLISAGMGNLRNINFYICITLIITYGLLPLRTKRYSPAVWIILTFFAAGLGFMGHEGIDRLSMKINDMVMEYYLKYNDPDPFKRSTGLGDIGELKLSSKILFRVKFPEKDFKGSLLLRETSYNKFGYTSWYAASPFINIKPASLPDSEAIIWNLNPADNNFKTMIFYSRYGKQKTLLKLPVGSFQIKDLKAKSLQKNSIGTVSAQNSPALIKGVVKYSPDLSFDSPAGQYDLHIPKAELDTIIDIKNQLNLDSKTMDEKLLTIKNYFLKNYSYSLTLKKNEQYKTYLENFLKNSKSGHCEFFATASVLLLRSAGVPARYTCGYLVHEYSAMENMYVVRQKDAHAWAMAEIDGKWQHFDTTPPSWVTIDKSMSEKSFLNDLTSWMFFNLSKLRHETGAYFIKHYGLWLLLPLGLFLFFRLRSDKRIQRIITKNIKDKSKDFKVSKTSSKFYLIEKALIKLGYERLPFETYSMWFKRLENDSLLSLDFHTLQLSLKAYEKERFSINGLNKDEKNYLNNHVDDFLNRLTGLSP